jgi:putative ABC transport system permease protein
MPKSQKRTFLQDTFPLQSITYSWNPMCTSFFAMRDLLNDLRIALRALRNNPSFTIAAVVTLGLAIAANTTVFTWIDGVLLHPIPGARNASELVALEEISSTGTSSPCAQPDFRDFQSGTKLLAGAFATHFTPFTIGERDQAERVFGQVVTANFFSVLGVKPLAGRFFLPQEDRDERGAFPYAVISQRLWNRRFHKDPGAVGKVVRMNGHPLTVIGVAPEEFRGTVAGLSLDVWVPLSMILEMGALNTWAVDDRNARFLDATVRLKPGVSIERARSEVAAIAQRLAVAFPKTHAGTSATLMPLWRAHSGAQSLLLNPLRILMAIAIVVLLIACGNVTNLLLVRSISRQKEFGIRLALGGGRLRLIRLVLAEALLVAGAGALAGLWLAQWAQETLAFFLPTTDLPISTVLAFAGQGAGGRVVVFTILASLGAAALAAVMPVLATGRVAVNDTLKEGGRGGSPGTRSHRARGLLVIFEVALASVALVGAGLFLRSLQNSKSIHPGFEPRNVLVARFYLSSAGYPRREEKQFIRTLRQRLETAPGIRQVSYADWVPLWFGQSPFEGVRVDGFETSRTAVVNTSRTLVAPGYFDLMRIPLVAGRDFTERDDGASPSVLIVNQTFARRFFPGRDPVGRQVQVSGNLCTVVGVAHDSKQNNLAEAPFPYFYVPFEQGFGTGHSDFLYIRTEGDPDTARAALRHEVAALDGSPGLYDAMALTEYMQASLFPQRVAAGLLGPLGLLSLLLAAVGLYSVMAYAVGERTREIGIRMALGAQPRQVLAMVLRSGLILAVAGLAVGLALALACARVVRSLLVEVGSADPLAFGGAALFLAAVAFAASYLPARRATKVDPMSSLRSE